MTARRVAALIWGSLRRVRGRDACPAHDRSRPRPAERHLLRGGRPLVPDPCAHVRLGGGDRRSPRAGELDRLDLLADRTCHQRPAPQLAVRRCRPPRDSPPSWRTGSSGVQHGDRRGDRGTARPLAAPVSGRAAPLAALATGAGEPPRRNGAARTRGDVTPGQLRRAVRAGIEPVRPRGCAWGDGRGRPRRLALRVGRDRARSGGDDRSPAARAWPRA